MFICKDVAENIIDYVDQELDDKTLEELEKHQHDCPECKAFVMTYKKMLQLIGRINKKRFVTAEVRKRLKNCLRACLNQGKI
jgi:anti-sigma factor RsiW